jgi:hypothetical protein
MTGWRDVLKIHPAAELFPLMGPDELRALGDDIKANGLKSEIVLVGRPPLLLDGRNRLDAMESVGMTVIGGYEPFKGCPLGGDLARSDVKLRTEDDPYAYVISANIHRRHLTAAQKGELVAALLKARPERSDRATAAIAKVSDKTVGAVRGRLEGRAEIPHVERRADTKGRSQPASKPKQRGNGASPPTPTRREIRAYTIEAHRQAENQVRKIGARFENLVLSVERLASEAWPTAADFRKLSEERRRELESRLSKRLDEVFQKQRRLLAPSWAEWGGRRALKKALLSRPE